MRLCAKRSNVRTAGCGLLLAIVTLASAIRDCQGQNSRVARGPSIFDEPPHAMNCSDRPAPLPPGEHMFMSFSPQAPYARTRLDTVTLTLREVPALTIASQPVNRIQIAGGIQDHWTLHLCAMGEGNTAEEANRYMQNISMWRTGGLLTLKDTDARGLVGGKGTLHVEAPADAPVTVHSDGGVSVYRMAGPVRITASMAVIANSSGLVDASASQIFFAGSQGSVVLNASWDIDMKFNAQHFQGELHAYAVRKVHALFPPGFQTPFSVVVNRSKNFVCRADFCSKIKKTRENSLYIFTYGAMANASERMNLRSENGQVSLETMP